MQCKALHPESGGQCRVEGSHPKHLIGYGKSMLTWKNEDFQPIPARIGRRELVDMARRIKEAQK